MMGWMAPLRHRGAKLVFPKNHQEREPSMSKITTIGLDLAKHVFQVHGIDDDARLVQLDRLRIGGQGTNLRELANQLANAGRFIIEGIAKV
jgi:hypothetical protein